MKLEKKFDAVDHPRHYASGSIECIDAIEAALTPEEFSGYCKGNMLKYTWRAGHKGSAAEDISKARWYATRLEAALKKDGSNASI